MMLNIAALAPVPSAIISEGDDDKAGMRAHAAQRVADVLTELRGVLARADREQRAGVGRPHPRDADRPRASASWCWSRNTCSMSRP